MLYDFFHIFYNIRKNFYFYLFLILELLLCISLIIIGNDENKSYNKRQEIYEKEEELGLESLLNDSYFLTDINLRNHMSRLENKGLIYAEVFHVDYISKDGKVNNFQLVSASSSFFKKYFNISAQNNRAYVTEKCKSRLENISSLLSNDLEIGDGSNLILENKTYTTNVIDYKYNIPTSQFESGDLNIDKSIFIKISGEEMGRCDFSFIKTDMGAKTSDIFKKTSTNLDIDLNSYNLLAEFENGATSQAAYVRLFSWVAIISFSVISIGTSAMVLLFMDNRKNNLRIFHILGASLSRIRMQIFIELALIYLLGIGFSFIAAYLLREKLSSPYYLIRFDISSLIMIVVLTCTLLLFITAISTLNLHLKNARED